MTKIKTTFDNNTVWLSIDQMAEAFQRDKFAVEEETEGIARIVKRIGTSYAYYYNHKHQRVGHVFQDRFISEGIKDDAQLLEVIRVYAQ